MIDLARPRVPALREDPHELLGARIPRPCGDAPRDADALLDDLLVAELGEALGRAQDSLERAATPRAEQSREVRLARLRVGDFPEAAELTQPPVDVAGRHHARPVAALDGGDVRLAPQHLGAGEVIPRQRGFDAFKLGLPGDIGVGAEDVVSQKLDAQQRQDRQHEHRNGGQGQRVRPAARPGLSHRCLHVAVHIASGIPS